MRKISKIIIGIIVMSSFMIYFGIMMHMQIENEPQMYKEWDLDDYSVDDCFWVKKDMNGYLEKICIYIIENKIAGASDPTKYSIWATQEQIYKDKEVIAISLNCCYTGDVAYIDKYTKNVIKFNLGAK